MPVERSAADLIVTNGRVLTLDPLLPRATAVAARKGRIIGVGSHAETEPLRDARTEVIDARGRTVLPAFHDAHTHTHGAALAARFQIDWTEHRDIETLDEAFAIIRARAGSLPPRTWIISGQFLEERLAEKRYPTRWELDAVTGDHPFIMTSSGNHVLMANSRALALGGIGRDTPDPPGGKIDRDEHGEPTGVLRERGKLRLDPRAKDSVVPAYTMEQRLDALEAIHRRFLAHGVVSYHDIVLAAEEIAAYQLLRRAGKLRTRVQLLIRGIESRTPLEHVIELGLQPGFGDDWLSFGGIKMSIDGGSLQKNAALYQPYPGEPDNVGIVRIEKDELEAKVMACHQADLRVVVHAIGPRALDMALEAFGKALEAYPRSDHRHRIEHCGNLPLPWERFDRVRDLGILAGPQPGFIPMYGDKWLAIFGEDRMQHAFPFKSMLERGVKVVSGTDFAMVPIDPMVSLDACVTRRTLSGRVLGPEERLTVDESLPLLITAPAFAAFQEDRKGTLSLGKLADFVVLSEDLHAVPPAELCRVKVDATVVDGRVAYRRDGTDW